MSARQQCIPQIMPPLLPFKNPRTAPGTVIVLLPTCHWISRSVVRSMIETSVYERSLANEITLNKLIAVLDSRSFLSRFASTHSGRLFLVRWQVYGVGLYTNHRHFSSRWRIRRRLVERPYFRFDQIQDGGRRPFWRFQMAKFLQRIIRFPLRMYTDHIRCPRTL